MNDSLNFSGLGDLPQPTTGGKAQCRCGSLARVASGLCVSCLLRTGLESKEANVEDFDALLAVIDIPDRDWQLGNYRILEEIGRGGMGVIYRARHTPSRRIVALKRVLNYHSDSHETLVRFQREARAAASLDHPNILPIFDVGQTDDGLPFFTMKFAVRGSLLVAKENFRDSPRRAIQLIAAVARGVDYAHGQGILHRDLKPGNILLDARGEPMVSDFGLAKWLDNASDLTRTLTVFGTPGYIAPEQAESKIADLTPATDIYSLGAILFELLSGRPPFLGEHAVAVLRQASENEAPSLRSIVPKASRDLETICARCLEREPNLRYSSAAALAEDLDRWLASRPIRARPISAPARGYRWVRRNPVLAGIFIICLVCVTAIVTRQVQSWKLEKQIRESELTRNSVAILPFLDLDNATEEPRWTATFGHELQANLSDIGSARVVSIGMGADAKTAARDNRTRSVLFGTRRKTNHGTEISVQLLSPDGDVLFDRIFDQRESLNLKGLTRDLAPALFAVLNTNDWATLIASRRDLGLENQQARELMTAGREIMFHYNTRDLDRAISCFEKAVKLEPRSALAHAYLAGAAAGRTHYLEDPNLLAYAEREVEEASALAPNSGDVLRVLAGLKYQRGQFRKALEDGLRALEHGAPDGKSAAMLGMVYNELGHPDQALRWFELASRFDPRPGEYDCHIGDCWAALGCDEKARSAYRRSIDLHPDRSQGWISIARLYLLNADFDRARSLCRRLGTDELEDAEHTRLAAQVEFFARNFAEAQKLYVALEHKDPAGGGSFYGGISYESALGRLNKNAVKGVALLSECLAKESNRLESAPDNPDTLYQISAIESSLLHTESAIEHLQAAVAAGWIDYRSLSLDPRFDAIAEDVRFQTILGKLKLHVEELFRATKTGSQTITNQHETLTPNEKME